MVKSRKPLDKPLTRPPLNRLGATAPTVAATTSENKTNKSRTSIKCLIIISSSVLLPAILISSFMYNMDHMQRLEPIKYADVLSSSSDGVASPPPMHKWIYLDRFFSTASLDLFRSLALQSDSFFTTINEHNGVESAGEAVPVGHINCRHPFMTLNLNRTMCHFSNRLDVGMHFVKTGGFNGHIEYLEHMVARMLPFRKRLIPTTSSSSPQTASNSNSVANMSADLKSLPEFVNDEFLAHVRSVCMDSNVFQAKVSTPESIVTEIFQLDLLIMLPGQELPIHLNAPYFWGADRHSFPQWLLVAMKNSHLFDDLFIPQVKGFIPLELDETQRVTDRTQGGFVEINGRGGDFFFYPYKPKLVKTENSEDSYSEENTKKFVILKSIDNSAILLNGADLMHGMDRYRPNDLPPLFGANHHYTLRRSEQPGAYWHLYDSENNLLRRYASADLKLILVFNMHCFGSERDRVKFHSQSPPPSSPSNSKSSSLLTLDDIMEVFKRDLRSRDRLPSEKIEPLELWTIVLKEYLRYPTNRHQQNSTLFGLNYCLLPNLAPEWLNKHVLQPFLAHRC